MDYQINQLYFLTLINKYRTNSILKPSTMRLKFYCEIRSNIQLMEDLQFLRSFKSLSVPISRHKDGHWCLLSPINITLWEIKIGFTFMLLFEFKQQHVNNKTRVEILWIKNNSKLTIECGFSMDFENCS